MNAVGYIGIGEITNNIAVTLFNTTVFDQLFNLSGDGLAFGLFF